MGNSASSHAQQRTGRPTDPKYDEKDRQRSSSPAPVPGQPHSSMRQKKRSLELPDFNRSTLTASQPRGRQKTPPKSQAINIPKAATDAPPARRPHNNFSSSELIVPATHLPFPPNQRSHGSGSGYVGGRGHRSRGGPQPMQSIYNESSQPQIHHQRPPSPPSPTPFVNEVVNSSIPIGLLEETENQLYNEGEEEAAIPARPEDLALTEPVTVKITWQGGGKNVVLARAGDDDWNGRQPMEKESPASNTWTATIQLPPGTHHIRFLVDDQWRVSDELSTAVDDQGSLANYVNVQPRTPPAQSTPLPPVTPSQPPQLQQQSTPQTRPHVPGQSFWSAGSSVDDGGDEYRPSNQQNLHIQVTQAKWTSTLPPELIEAAREEEAYLTASAGQYDAVARSVHVSGFVPAPNIPPAPGMPRHLDRLILNTKVTLPSHSSGNSNTGSPSRGGGGLPGGVGSGQGGTSSRDRERSDRGKREGRDRRRREERERERESRREEREREKREQRRAEERERERRERELQQHGGVGNWRDSGYANFPPAPPPSEDGTGAGLDEKPEHSPVRGGIEEEVEIPLQESSDATAITTPEPTPTPTPERESSTQDQSTPSAPPPSTQLPTPQPIPQRPGPSPITGESRGPVSGSRAITLDTENIPPLTDDASVLPVPSHVVLQHLCTSAIRNGVLAVATTTRYRKKYMTTVYYKPTAM